jgi:hypothetical protein
MALDSALIGATLTGILGLASQCLSKIRCYTSCRRNDDDEVCERQLFCGFMDSTLLEMQGRAEPEPAD